MLVMNRSAPATKRYFWRLGISLALYAAVLFPVDWAIRHGQMPGGIWLYVAAAAPAIPVLGVIWAMLRFLEEEEDEFQRYLRVRAFLGATGLTLAITTVWGFLENFAAVTPMPAIYVFFIFMVSLGLVQGVTKWWHR